MKTIAKGMFILAVLLTASSCAQTNSAQTSPSANAARVETNANFSAGNTYLPNYRMPDTSSEIPRSDDASRPIDEPIAEGETDESPNYTMRF